MMLYAVKLTFGFMLHGSSAFSAICVDFRRIRHASVIPKYEI